MLSRPGSHPSRTWLGAFALLGLAFADSACGGGNTAKAPADAADAPLPPPAYEAALPEAVRAHLFERFTGDFDQMAARRLNPCWPASGTATGHTGAQRPQQSQASPTNAAVCRTATWKLPK